MERHLTGAYVRVKRGDKWCNVDISDCTDQERTEMLKNCDADRLIGWINFLCHSINGIGEMFDIVGGANK